jgi:hypothetical protein
MLGKDWVSCSPRLNETWGISRKQGNTKTKNDEEREIIQHP